MFPLSQLSGDFVDNLVRAFSAGDALAQREIPEQTGGWLHSHRL